MPSAPADVLAAMDPRFPDALRLIKSKAKVKLLPPGQLFNNLKSWTISATITPNVEDGVEAIKLGTKIQMAGGILEELLSHNFTFRDPVIRFKDINTDDAAPAIEVSIKHTDISEEDPFYEMTVVANASHAILLIVVAISNIITDYQPYDDLVKELFEILERME